MFSNLKYQWSLIVSDWLRYYQFYAWYKLLFTALTAKNHCFAYSFWLRLASKKSIVYPIARIMHYRLSRKYSIQISPFMQLGKGLYIGHGCGIVINGFTTIGENCNISQFLSIGTNHNTPAKIGNNVYIGPNVCIVENVNIGDNVIIGAGTVVINDVPSNSTTVGNPNRIIRH